MSKITVWFIKCAMVYFLLAIVLGLHMAVSGTTYPYMPIHAHFNLLGWMSMMIYGVGYHILPRFSGKPLYSEKIAEWQFWLANVGLIGMAIGWMVRSWQGDSSMLLIFAIVEAVSSVMFVVNMFKTIKAAPAPSAAK
ncbi:MAG TPA: cbb3-type cytochrome c oxidase subunit I [Thermodesulfobacteriota bacterium]|nr:cbb3-type cytochrome c oxidase subunit I [Thermodesulfobacteriota bacterium]